MSGSIFDKREVRSRVCPTCGEKNAMTLSVAGRLLDNKGALAGPSVSRQASYCQKHGEALYLELIAEIGRRP